MYRSHTFFYVLHRNAPKCSELRRIVATILTGNGQWREDSLTFLLKAAVKHHLSSASATADLRTAPGRYAFFSLLGDKSSASLLQCLMGVMSKR